ncbi:hypothetical protein VaNZ11_006754 [Volvox africanus]|uniref:FAD/NAD(P)-binding domain-containing protein n=1 Tax=Volvox africanus TaxID=51714 RepID=A0ABQ5S1D3_9CHLO|nr:hypothetical protein VaNZ11_006754 [Volvox africanus]
MGPLGRRDLVLLGGGHSHVEVLRVFGQLARQRLQRNSSSRQGLETPLEGKPVRKSGGAAGDGWGEQSEDGSGGGASAGHHLTLISRGRFTPYSGMLPGWASGFYSYSDCHIDLQRLASYAGARLVLAEATGIDTLARTVSFGGDDSKTVAAQPPVPYDVLSIDIGITPGSAVVPGADEHATPVKPIDRFVRQYEKLLERYRAAAAAAAPPGTQASGGAGRDAQGPRPVPLLQVCVVGGGAGGVELAAAVRYRLEEERRRGGWSMERASVAVSLLCRGALLPGHPPHVRRLVRQLLIQRGVEVRSGDAVTEVRSRELLLYSGERVPYDECLWCTEASPAPWLSQTGLPTDPEGFLCINEKLQSEGGPSEVFAAGDVATCSSNPRPKAGVFAVRQGPPLAQNLRSFLDGEPIRPFVPQVTVSASRAVQECRTGELNPLTAAVAENGQVPERTIQPAGALAALRTRGKSGCWAGF